MANIPTKVNIKYIQSSDNSTYYLTIDNNGTLKFTTVAAAAAAPNNTTSYDFNYHISTGIRNGINYGLNYGKITDVNNKYGISYASRINPAIVGKPISISNRWFCTGYQFVLMTDLGFAKPFIIKKDKLEAIKDDRYNDLLTNADKTTTGKWVINIKNTNSLFRLTFGRISPVVSITSSGSILLQSLINIPFKCIKQKGNNYSITVNNQRFEDNNRLLFWEGCGNKWYLTTQGYIVTSDPNIDNSNRIFGLTVENQNIMGQGPLIVLYRLEGANTWRILEDGTIILTNNSTSDFKTSDGAYLTIMPRNTSNGQDIVLVKYYPDDPRKNYLPNFKWEIV